MNPIPFQLFALDTLESSAIHCSFDHLNRQQFTQMVGGMAPPNYKSDLECYLNSINQRLGWVKPDDQLRNANQQIRSEPFNQQSVVSPWMQSTINPDIWRRQFELSAKKF